MFLEGHLDPRLPGKRFITLLQKVQGSLLRLAREQALFWRLAHERRSREGIVKWKARTIPPRGLIVSFMLETPNESLLACNVQLFNYHLYLWCVLLELFRNRITRNRRCSCSFGSYSVFGMNGISFCSFCSRSHHERNERNTV